MSILSITKKSEVVEIELVRALSILAVLMIHSTSFATIHMKDYSSYWVYNFLNTFSVFAVPAFIFISSFVLFYNYYDRNMDKKCFVSFFQKRLLYILLPYLLFSLFYYTIVLVTHYQNESIIMIIKDLMIKLSTGTSYTHLYFIFISVQFYMMFPFILRLFQRFPKLVNYSILIGIGIQLSFRLLNLFVTIPHIGSWSLSYFSYYMLGAFIGIHYTKLKSWISLRFEQLTTLQKGSIFLLWIIWLCSGIVNVLLWFNFRAYATHYHLLVYEGLWSIFTFTSALVLFQFAFVLFQYLPSKGISFLYRIGQLSFGIFFVHPLLLAIYREFPPNNVGEMVLNFWYLGGFMLALFGSWAIVSFVNTYVPFSWMLFGKLKTEKLLTDHHQKSSVA